jgi:hypothetical protein
LGRRRVEEVERKGIRRVEEKEGGVNLGVGE